MKGNIGCVTWKMWNSFQFEKSEALKVWLNMCQRFELERDNLFGSEECV